MITGTEAGKKSGNTGSDGMFNRLATETEGRPTRDELVVEKTIS